jgi:alkaline phosphatase
MKTIRLFSTAAFLFFSFQLNASNVILFIGDGMDDQQITAARNYLYGAEGKTVLDNMKIRSSVQVLTVDEEDPKKMIYVADSANSATSMATGENTSRGRIATSAKTDKDIETIVELAQKAGLKTGIVTSASITDATPSSFVAHISSRGCESAKHMTQYRDKIVNIIDCSQDTKRNGGKGSIAEQLANSEVDLMLGGGRMHFTEKNEAQDKTILQEAREHKFVIVDSLNQAASVNTNQKLLGLFADKHLPVRMQGEQGAKAEQAEFSFLNSFHRYIGSVELPKIMNCEDNPEFFNNNTPQLKDMTKVALDRLDNEKGFFLMIESASIDKQSHMRQPCGAIGEVRQLFGSVEVALAFAKDHPDTLVMVTADHAQAAQIVPNGSMFDVYGVPIASPGHIARIRTKEGGVMVINYATNLFDGEEHTGASVPLFANQQVVKDNGDLIKPFLHQKEIFNITKTFLGL